MATAQFHQGALRVLRPHYLDDSGQVCYAVVNPGGGYLGGDRYRITVDVAAGARLLFTTQSATKVYRTPGSRAEQHVHVRLGPGSALESVPDQLIAYRDASYTQVTTVDMDPTASVVLAEVVTPGWAPDGGLFRYDEIRLRNEISVGGRLTVLDNLLLRPDAGLSGMCSLERYTHVGSLLVMDSRVDAALVDELHDLLGPMDPDGQLGLTLLDGPGVALRALANATEPLDAMIRAAVDLLRRRWHGQGPLNLRKY
nr:urease accessory protein UreD [Specibacter cremeus]